ncbi:hypothetical protein [Amycolatopsis sp. cmx-4-83]|uniref:hypothetical protein n=1 Tax=Amycolatopsis sp. cmx-4-83 TaxID=2790940 RepID=UPI0039789A4B
MTEPDIPFHVAVDRSLTGQDVGRDLTRAEKAVIARGLEARHFTHRAIAFHLGMHEDAIPRLLHGRPAKKGPQQ